MSISNFSLSFSLWNWLNVSGAFSLVTKRSNAACSLFSYLSVSVAMRYKGNLSFYFLQFSAKFPLKVIFPGGFYWSIFFSFPSLFFLFFSFFWHCIMCLCKEEERRGEVYLSVDIKPLWFSLCFWAFCLDMLNTAAHPSCAAEGAAAVKNPLWNSFPYELWIGPSCSRSVVPVY